LGSPDAAPSMRSFRPLCVALASARPSMRERSGHGGGVSTFFLAMRFLAAAERRWRAARHMCLRRLGHIGGNFGRQRAGELRQKDRPARLDGPLSVVVSRLLFPK
jgi:hypothetical protein